MIEDVKHKGLALLILAGAQFMVVLDATIVNVALPSIQKALEFTSAAQLQWIVTAYTLVFGGFLLLGGRLSDLLGRRRIFLAGIALFAIASLLGGFAQSPGMLIAFRALQGLGAALLSPAALALVLNIFAEGKERNRALGIWSGVAAGGGAVGLLLGGILTEYVDWRWIFFINVPVAIALAFFTPRLVPNSLPHEGSKRIDFTGAITITAGLMTLVYGLVKVPEYGWTGGQTLLAFGIALALIAAFVINELRFKVPLVPLRIFTRRNLSAANLMQLPIIAAMFGTFFYLSIYQQQLLGYSPVEAGLAGLPFTLVIGVVAGVVSKLVLKTGFKPILVVAPLFVAAGLLYFARLPLDGKYVTDILPGIVLMSIGMAASFVAITLAATSGVPHKDAGLASGLLNTSQQIGGALGLAVLTAVSTSKTTTELAAAHGNPAALPGAMLSGFQAAFYVGVVLVLGAAVIALVGLKNHKPTEKELAEDGLVLG
jgi:EmrB/QacA subfamily drug resistance transporter